ncbi:hypothetical protein F5Y19DRAFT_199834 [Xylariaceae sp. FL1651]|nr:hypothetical protein F5Y19DRAFT_199834 [Xylariaceae sp. FL1651]
MSLSNSVSVAHASTHVLSSRAPAVALPRVLSLAAITPTTSLPATTARAPRSRTTVPVISQPELTSLWFNSTIPRFDLPTPGSDNPNRPEDERKVKLGKTLRILQERLPSLLQSPLPQEILSPNISLHLFPSTHPYLPAVSGRVAYIAALWTSPIAWNRVPIIGNVRLEILSERMVSQPLHFSPRRSGAYGEQLVVKWRTASSSSGNKEEDVKLSLAEQGEYKLDAHLRGTQTTSEEKKAFTGLFIFEFDKDGRILSHTIEHVDEGGEWEKGVGARVVGLTDWLLGGIKGRTEGGTLPSLFEIAVKERENGLG